MIRESLKLGGPSACLLASALLVLAACDQELPQLVDASLDTGADVYVDMGADPVEDDGSTACTFPEGPYAFSTVGNTVGPMAWPSAVAGMDELLAADLHELHCDPSVHSIFVQIVAIS